MNPTELVSTPGILTTTIGNYRHEQKYRPEQIWYSGNFCSRENNRVKSGETGGGFLKHSKKKKERKVETDLRHTAEAELLELGHQQEYFGEIKKIEKLKHDF